MRLYLGIPTGGSPAQPFVESLRTLLLPANVSAFERGIVTGNFVPAQRDVLVERAVRWGADTIAMCDDDMVLPADALVGLCAALYAHETVALVGALYYSRDGLRPMAVDGWEAADTTRGWIPAFAHDPIAVDGVGFGCVVMRAAAVRAFERPFFASQIYVESTEGRVRVCNEDYLFCARLRASGYVTMLHPGVRCGHYDRARSAVAPHRWEPMEASNRRRVFVRSGDSYALAPLSEAPKETTPERHVRADVVYVETA